MLRSLCLSLSVFLVAATAGAQADQANTEPAAPPPQPARSIPGITAPDAFPEACVSCHVEMPREGIDARLSTALERWKSGVEPALLAKAQSAAPADITLKGKHPSSTRALQDVPAACIRCHDSSKKAPDFPAMIHLVHLTGGEENHFLSLFQGECTHCHKLDTDSGAWSVPSAAEPPADQKREDH